MTVQQIIVLILFVVAAICAAVAGWAALDNSSDTDQLGWVAGSLFFGWAALAIERVPVRRPNL